MDNTLHDSNLGLRPAPRLAIVVPCYNEEKVLSQSSDILLKQLNDMKQSGDVASDSFILFCDDGSKDNTWSMIVELYKSHKEIGAIKLAHNRGQQAAMLAGLMCVREISHAAVTIDADIQDDPHAIAEMVKKYREGADIVYGVRASRQSDKALKRFSARAFYKLQNSLGLETVYDHSEFRLMDRKCLDILAQYSESNLYLRGIMPQIGLNSAIVTYDRSPRLAGETKYSFSKLLSLSIDGITSFTAKPMRLIFMVGFALLVIDLFVAIWVFVSYFLHNAISGWSSLMLSIWFLGSLMLMGLGIVGEYIGKIYIEVKNRPRYNLSETLLPDDKK